MQLEDIDLLAKSITELTDEELEQRLIILKSLKFKEEKVKAASTTTKAKAKPHKTNKDKQVENLLKGVSPEQLKLLLEKLK